MRYSVNYTGALFIDDNEGFNCFETDNFDEAMCILRAIIDHRVDKMAYLKDEEYQCSLYWDDATHEYYWA
jgi:hypothetical protein